jgi:hypothetical protein
VIRSDRQLVQNRLEVLRRCKRELDAQVALVEGKLSEERQRYESLAERWQTAAPDSILTTEDRETARAVRRRAFARGFTVGLTLTSLVGLLAILAR